MIHNDLLHFSSLPESMSEIWGRDVRRPRVRALLQSSISSVKSESVTGMV